ncbi:MAG TPA: glutamate synthase subunit alpha, partial [Gammaproteobacteria bacterium]|nr:glutamate synthase subunit alpha [Gammaproteobacteria bacterium]
MKSAKPELTQPPVQGLYDPRNEHDACGVGFVAHIKNHKSHGIVQQGLEILEHLTHRGAVGADPAAGDGAGILIQIPDDFLRQECARLNFDLPTAGAYGVAMVSLPQDLANQQRCIEVLEQTIIEKGLLLIGWREIPTDREAARLPDSVISCEPCMRQLFVARGPAIADQNAFERKLFVIRKMVENRVRELALKDVANFYIASLSTRTLVYKGMFLSYQIGAYYTDLQDPRLTSAMALVHQRFSTNTFPAWELAHPFRMIAHNGEINTLRGNINWMAARKNSMSSEILGDDLDDIWPLIVEGKSDSACFDNALELLVMGGYSLGHAMMLMIPEAWADNALMDEKRRAFYEYHAALMEPWDGPAGVAFTDGRQIGATLDRNGLRPARYIVTDDNLVVMASEVGVLPIPEQRIVKKWRLQPGKMFLIDLEQGRIIDDNELKAELANARPYQSWLAASQIRIENLPTEVAALPPDPETMLERQQAFGYTQEDLKFLMGPTAANGQEPTGSMGNDTPLAIFSDRPRPLNHYFKQLFAQVTNPAIDPIREQLVMSLISIIGPRPNLLNLQASGPQLRLEVEQPILCNEDLEKIRAIADHTDNRFRTITLRLTFPAAEGATGLERALQALCKQAEQAVREEYNIIILSDRDVDRDHAPIPSLLGTSAVHHHLIRNGLRTETGLVVETGSAREVHHFCLLAGYGAEVINPYLAFETVADMHQRGLLPAGINEEEAVNRYVRGINKGLLKVMSKMGISTYQSYCGSQIFEAIGLGKEFIDKYFTGTASPIDGAGITEISREVMERHQRAYGNKQIYRHTLDTGGGYAWRLRGERHNWTPETISLLQHATRANDVDIFHRFSDQINTQNKQLLTLRGMFRIKTSQQAIPLEDVEPASEIVKRFSTGAMSFGSISYEAHSTIAIAM